MAVMALKASCATRATRYVPPGVWTSAALPTEASAGVASILIAMALLATVASTTGSAAAIELGDVGDPPQLSINDPTVTNVRACVQNSRRDDLSDSMTAALCNGYAAGIWAKFHQHPRKVAANCPTIITL
jgi:hypothetical protein